MISQIEITEGTARIGERALSSCRFQMGFWTDDAQALDAPSWIPKGGVLCFESLNRLVIIPKTNLRQ